jgi:hypothetical protein
MRRLMSAIRNKGIRYAAALVACGTLLVVLPTADSSGAPAASASAGKNCTRAKAKAKARKTARKSKVVCPGSGGGGSTPGSGTTTTTTTPTTTTVPTTTTTPPPTTTTPPPTTTTPPPTTTTPPPDGMTTLRSDPVTNPDPLPLWNQIAAQDNSRASWSANGGPSDAPYRRLTVLDGDNYSGERAELAYNSRINGLGAPWGTFFLYNAGDRRVTSFDMRLPSDFPINTSTWQVVMQMKQTGPSANSGGTPVIALEARQGRWVITQSDSPGSSSLTHELWSTPASLNTWTHISFDVTYSPNPSLGRIQATVGGVQSPTFTTYTEKYEISPGSQGLNPGDPIPSHLRLGVYHNPTLPGTHVDFTNIQVKG